MRTLLALALLAGTAHADTLVATHIDDTLFVHQLAKDKVTKVSEEKGRGAYAYAFAGSALWVLRRTEATGATLGTIVGGTASPTRPITFADFKLAAEPAMPAHTGGPGILATRGGQVWLTMCARTHGKGMRVVCDNVYLRVDDGSMTYSAAAPKDIAFEFGAVPTPPKPIAKAPAGYRIKIVTKTFNGQKLPGLDCTGPSSKVSWPGAGDINKAIDTVDFVPHPIKTSWISASPAIAHATLGGTTPIGEKLSGDMYVVGCSTIGDVLVPLAGGGWLLGKTTVSGDGWRTDNAVLTADGAPVGTIPGSDPDSSR